MDWRSLMLLALFAWAWEARAAAPDPVTSVMWDYYHQRLLNGEAFVFDDKIRLEVPPFAEDARQVPIQIDASAAEQRSGRGQPAIGIFRCQPRHFNRAFRQQFQAFGRKIAGADRCRSPPDAHAQADLFAFRSLAVL